MASFKSLALRLLPPRTLHAFRVLRHVTLRPFEQEIALIPRYVGPGSLAIDVGANVGLYCHVLSRHAGRVLALEPDAGCAEYLRALRLRNVIVAQVAASETEGTAVLRTPVIRGRADSALGTIAEANALSTDACAVEQVVRTAPLDDVLGELDLAEPVSFLKIDVEGHELAVLRGASRLLAEQRPPVLVELEVRHGASVEAVFELLGETGHRPHAWRDGTLRPISVEELVALQSPELLARKQADLSFSGYVNNILFLPEPRHG